MADIDKVTHLIALFSHNAVTVGLVEMAEIHNIETFGKISAQGKLGRGAAPTLDRDCFVNIVSLVGYVARGTMGTIVLKVVKTDGAAMETFTIATCKAGTWTRVGGEKEFARFMQEFVHIGDMDTDPVVRADV